MKKMFWLVVLFSCACTRVSSPTSPSEEKMNATEALLSFSFDDNRTCAFQNAIPVLDSVNLKSTNYIITRRLGSDDYMAEKDILSLQSRGHEVGGHTRTHPDLTTLSLAEAQSEIKGSRQDLLEFGIRRVESFAYPFGAYNQALIQSVMSAGFTNARSTDGGFNSKGPNVFALKRQNLGGSLKIGQVRTWVDEAVNNKQWLILVTHHVDYQPNDYSITPDLFREIVNYVVSKKIKVVTISEGVKAIGS